MHEDLLHDEIDAIENRREEVKTKADALREQLVTIARSTTDIKEVFAIAATLYANDLADDTSLAVREGFALTKKQQKTSR